MPGQNVWVSFVAAADQRLDLGVTEVYFDAGAGVSEITILDPKGAPLVSRLVGISGRGIHTEPLSAGGTHTIVIDPANARSVSLLLTLSQSIGAALDPTDQPASVTLRPGQTARLTFDATAGERANVGITDVDFSNGSQMVVSMLRPDRSNLLARSVGTGGGDIDTDALPEDGTYKVLVDPRDRRSYPRGPVRTSGSRCPSR